GAKHGGVIAERSVSQVERSALVVNAAALVVGGVARNGTAGQRHGTAIVEQAPSGTDIDVRAIVTDGAVGKGQRAAAVVEVAALRFVCVAGNVAASQRHVTVVDQQAPSVPGARVASRDRQPRKRRRSALDVEGPAGGAASYVQQARPRADN